MDGWRVPSPRPRRHPSLPPHHSALPTRRARTTRAPPRRRAPHRARPALVAHLHTHYEPVANGNHGGVDPGIGGGKAVERPHTFGVGSGDRGIGDLAVVEGIVAQQETADAE